MLSWRLSYSVWEVRESMRTAGQGRVSALPHAHNGGGLYRTGPAHRNRHVLLLLPGCYPTLVDAMHPRSLSLVRSPLCTTHGCIERTAVAHIMIEQ